MHKCRCPNVEEFRSFTQLLNWHATQVKAYDSPAQLAPGKLYGYSMFIRRDKLLNEENGLCVNDTVIFETALTVISSWQTTSGEDGDGGGSASTRRKSPPAITVQPPSWSRDMEALLGASFCCLLRWRASYLNSCASNALIPNSIHVTVPVLSRGRAARRPDYQGSQKTARQLAPTVASIVTFGYGGRRWRRGRRILATMQREVPCSSRSVDGALIRLPSNAQQLWHV